MGKTAIHCSGCFRHKGWHRNARRLKYRPNSDTRLRDMQRRSHASQQRWEASVIHQLFPPKGRHLDQTPARDRKHQNIGDTRLLDTHRRLPTPPSNNAGHASFTSWLLLRASMKTRRTLGTSSIFYTRYDERRNSQVVAASPPQAPVGPKNKQEGKYTRTRAHDVKESQAHPQSSQGDSKHRPNDGTRLLDAH